MKDKIHIKQVFLLDGVLVRLHSLTECYGSKFKHTKIV